jgi:hypothetical protein
VRTVGKSGGDRWQKSIYLSTSNENRTVNLRDLVPVGDAPAAGPRLSEIRSILFVVDTTNTKAGASGRFWITRAALQNSITS